jgi:DNA-binding beta-propeller fold protein YncE
MSVHRRPHRIAAGLAVLVTVGYSLAPTPTHSRSMTSPLTGPSPTPGFTLFESDQVRPLALTPDRKLLLATNTPAHRLEIFSVRSWGLVHVASVSVGLEPVAVAARSNTEAWVVNHVSDSVSVVRLDGKGSRVLRTLHVGDEPRDVLFAGPNRSRAFITTAHRGQNNPRDPQLTTPGVGRADVWVFDAGSSQDGTMGGTPLTVITLFTDTPRALAATPDGAKVYVAGFKTGNQTAALLGSVLSPAGYPGPATAVDGTARPERLALIVKLADGHWVDEGGRAYDPLVKFNLPDKDVFVIDALASPPQPLAGSAGSFSGVGTILFNMAVNPVNGKVYVSNLESNNAQRFEGANGFAGGSTLPAPSVRGRLAFSRISVLGEGTVSPRHLNKHVDYDQCCAPVPNEENARSVAFPLDMAVTRDGETLYVASLGTSEVAVYGTAALEDDTFVPDVADQIPVTGGGPTGLALDEDRHRLYVLTRFDNAIKLIDTRTRREVGRADMHNPEPASVVAGRRFLYDASLSSSHGDSACFSCHVFGDMDNLAWDLGNPDNTAVPNPNPFSPGNVPNSFPVHFNPLKGPMATQSLRGMANHGPMHWRGDRTGGAGGPSVQPDGGAYDEEAAFLAFSGAFPALLGRHAPIADEDMRAFAHFALQLTYPPNPIRRLDNTLTPTQQAGFAFFHDVPSAVNDPAVAGDELSCNQCHRLDRTANAEFGVAKPGFFGSDNNTTEIDLGRTQHFKNPHLRNAYQKVGMFGFPPPPQAGFSNSAFQGDQIRGFGFSQDAVFDTLENFLRTPPFRRGPANPQGIPIGPEGDATRRQIEDFLLSFDSNLFPVVGQQVTLNGTNRAAADPRIDLLLQRADAGEAKVVATIRFGHVELTFVYAGGGTFAPFVPDGVLRALAPWVGGITYTALPPGATPRAS